MPYTENQHSSQCGVMTNRNESFACTLTVVVFLQHRQWQQLPHLNQSTSSGLKTRRIWACFHHAWGDRNKQWTVNYSELSAFMTTWILEPVVYILLSVQRKKNIGLKPGNICFISGPLSISHWGPHLHLECCWTIWHKRKSFSCFAPSMLTQINSDVLTKHNTVA